MRHPRAVISFFLILAALGLVALAFTTNAGSRAIGVAVAPAEDPDLPPGQTGIDKERYLYLREEWTMMRRGFDSHRPFDPSARERAIARMGNQLKSLETARQNRLRSSRASTDSFSVSAVLANFSAVWTPVGPAPIPQGQTEMRADPVTGRIISIAIHPTNPDIVFVGTASGGLYRTLNGTAANPIWTPMMDTIQVQSSGLNALGTLAIGAIAIAPSNPDIVYIGTGEQASGYFGSGLYRIDNATAATPTLVGPINPATDYGDNVPTTFTFRAISKILVHPTIPGTIFVSTSDGFGGFQGTNSSNTPNVSPPTAVLGLYRSTNATGAANAVSFTKLKVNNRFNFNTGYTDISDMVFDPSDATSNTLLAWIRNGDGLDSNCMADCAGVYRSTNALGAGTFAPQLVALNGNVRGELAVNIIGATVTVLAGTAEKPASVPGNPNPNMCAGDQAGLLRRSIDGGVTWLNTDATAAGQGGIIRAVDGFCATQCFYDIGLLLDPNNANLMQVGGTGNYGGCAVLAKRSTDGVTFARNDTGLHADVHAITSAPSNPATVWFGCDGGLWRSNDSGATWASMNGDIGTTNVPAGKISATQYFSIATHPRDRDFMTGGTQDNGTHMKRAASDTGQWTQIAFGDGGYTAIDQNATDTNNVTIYHTYYNVAGGQILYERTQTTADAKTKNWTSFNCIAGGAGNTALDCNDTAVLFYAPMVVGPGNPNSLYFGTDRLYRSGDSGSTMQLVSQGPITANVAVSSISVGLGNDNVRLVGLRDGTVWATTNGSNVLTNVTPPGAPSVTVGKVLIDPNNTNAGAITAYIGYGGFGTAATPITHLYKTTNLAGGAATWVAMSNGLPDIPIDSIVVDRYSAVPPAAGSTVYLGTDIGVYQSTDGGANWAVFNPGNTLPVLPVFDMAFQDQGGYPTRILRIATHGRGIWEMQTGSNPVLSPVILPNRHAQLNCIATPNRINNLQASPDLDANNFVSVTPAPAVADANGAFTYDDPGAVGQTKRFYRISYP